MTSQDSNTPKINKSTPNMSPDRKNEITSAISTLEPKNDIQKIPELAEESVESIPDKSPNQDLKCIQSSIVVSKRESAVSRK